MNSERLTEIEALLIGKTIEGEVEAVFRWGVIVNLGLSRVGLIDALYVDDGDNYQVGDRISGHLDSFDEQKDKFIFRPPGQIPLSERLRRAGEK
ncbi:hypothetical protein ACF07S_14095 [Streptomyces sp. NPDC016640]|uniref:hypothetical protein n=1 Tax=Streptomyces sp. NPDC016640 TaxID=3364969 RepID=UPI0036FB31E5